MQGLLGALPEMPGCVFTMDALHAVGETFELIVQEKNADFLVCVKDNASSLKRKLKGKLNRKRKGVTYARTVERAHGRIETRTAKVVPVSPAETGWPHTRLACRIERKRELIRNGKTVSSSTKEAIYVGSYSSEVRPADRTLQLTRGHWGIENCLHHRKDRSMDEDRNRASATRSGRFMCCIRSLVAMVLGRARESLSVIQRRLSMKPHLAVGLFSCLSLTEWERTYKPYKPKSTN